LGVTAAGLSVIHTLLYRNPVLYGSSMIIIIDRPAALLTVGFSSRFIDTLCNTAANRPCKIHE